MSLLNRIYNLYNIKVITNNNDNNRSNQNNNNNKHIISFQSISFAYAYISSYLNSADLMRYVTLFKSKSIRISLYKMKTDLTIPYYDSCYKQSCTLSRENLIQCTSLKLLYLHLEHDEEDNDTRACQITLRNFRIASMLGTFSNLQKLIISSSQWGDHLTFYPDFIDAIRNGGFKSLRYLKINVSLRNADDKFINWFIESISEYCVELEHLVFFGSDIMIKKNLIQAAIFSNTWPKLKSLQQEFLQVSESVLDSQNAIKYAIRSGLSPGSTQFPSFDTLVVTESELLIEARTGLCLPEGDMSQIKKLIFIGRVLMSPFLSHSHNIITTFSGLKELDISALELNEMSYIAQQNYRTYLNRLVVAISPSYITSLKLGFLPLRSDIIDIMLATSNCLDQLETLKIKGLNNSYFYDKHLVFGGYEKDWNECASGGSLFLNYGFEYFTRCEDCRLDEDHKYELIMASIKLLKHHKLRASLKHLKLGDFIDLEKCCNSIQVVDDESSDEFESYDYSIWAKTLSYYKKLISLDIKCFEYKAVNIIVKHIACNPPMNLSKINVKGPDEDSLFTNLHNRQKTIDHWFKPCKSILTKTLSFIYSARVYDKLYTRYRYYPSPSYSKLVRKDELQRWEVHRSK